MADNSDKQTMETTCVNLLRSAKTDNEKLAGLLIVPKLFESTNNEKDRNMDEKLQKELLDAIDFDFLKRMLSNKNKSQEYTAIGPVVQSISTESLALKTAALSVIVCFGAESVFESSQISQIILSVEEILVAISSEDDDDLPKIVEVSISETEPITPDDKTKLLNLCVQCLENFARNQEKQVIEDSMMPSLYRLVVKQTESSVVSKSIVELIGSMISEKGGVAWLSENTKIAVCAMYLHQIKIGGVDDIDFDLCERAARILAQIEVRSLPVKLYSLIDNVMGVLCDALKNKLPSKQRQQTLKLLTSLVQSRGIKQLIQDKGSKAALLLIHLCSIEVRMTLECDNQQQVIADSETLCSSFFALEQMIFYMAHEETTLDLDSKEILQVHSALQGAVSALLYFLSSCASQESIDKDLQGVVAACVRLLGAWTAEETESLQSKYTKALPDLIKICFDMLKDMDCLKFLIPGLSNLTTDTEAIVEIIVQKLDLMCQYVEHCCTQLCDKRDEYEHILVNTCVVLLNCLMMPEIKLESTSILNLLETTTKQSLRILSVCTNVDCNLTIIACGLASLRKAYELNENKLDGDTEDKYKDFYRESIDYVLSVTEKTKTTGAVSSSDIPEIWLMCVQVLNELMKYSETIKSKLIEDENIRNALRLFEKYSTNVDVVFVLERLLLTMADKAGTKDLITKVNKAKSRQGGQLKAKSKRK